MFAGGTEVTNSGARLHVRGVLIAFALATLSALPITMLRAASFDCAKASRPVEKLICQDAQVSMLDEYLDRYYRAARIAVGRGETCLRTEQRQWLSEVRDRCADRDCLRRAYLARLSQLDGLQPGATSSKNIELPTGDQLLGILAPAEDEVAAPRNSNSKPAEIRGQIVDDVEEGDGFVLRDEQGERHLLRPLMFLEPEDHNLLTAAARERESMFLVRGFIEGDGTSSAFDVSRCTYIYRLRAATPE